MQYQVTIAIDSAPLPPELPIVPTVIYLGGMVQGEYQRRSLERLATISASLFAASSLSIFGATLLRPDRSVALDGSLSLLCVALAVVLWAFRKRWRQRVLFSCVPLLQALLVGLMLSTSSDIFRLISMGNGVGIAVLAAWFFGGSPSRRLYLSVYALGTFVMGVVATFTAKNHADVAWASVSLGLLSLLVAFVITRLRSLEEQLVFTDVLTGALNRRGLERHLARMRSDRRQAGRGSVLIALDLDDLKAVNDTDGHSQGDRMLEEFVRGWRDHLRSSDCIARVGGDEFLVVLHPASLSDTARLRNRVAAATNTAFSAGETSLNPREALSAAIERADANLYEDKRRRKVRAPLNGSPLQGPSESPS